MKTIIAGSRSIIDESLVYAVIREAGFEITEVVCGCAKGVDTLGMRWARDNEIPVREFPPNFDKFGKAAPLRRNEQMAWYAEAVIIVWDGVSKGTQHMMEFARREKLKLYVRRFDYVD